MADLRMPQTQREQLMVVIAVLALLGAGAYWNYVYSPGVLQVAKVETHADSLELNVAASRRDFGSGSPSQMREQSKQYADNLKLMRDLVPTSNEVVQLLDQISTAARQVGLDLGKIEPLGVETGQDFDAYRYKMSVTGSYHDIAEFLTRTASLPRIVVPLDVHMNSVAGPGTDPKKTVSTVFQVHTYVAHSAEVQKGGD